MGQQYLFFETFNHSKVSDALNTWLQACPDAGVYALVAESSRDVVGDLQKICNELEVPIVGGVFPELMHTSIFAREGFLLVRMDEMPNYILTEQVQDEQAIEKLATQIEVKLNNKPNHRSLFLLFDAMVGNIGTILDQLYLRLADRVQYSGINAGSETFQPMPCLFDGKNLIGNGVLAMLMPVFGESEINHGYAMPKEMIAATATSGNCIHSIDWMPAFEVYKKMANEIYDVEINEENFYTFGAHFPFGIVLANGDVLVRIPVALSDKGELYCVGEVPSNSILTLMDTDKDILLSATKTFAQQLPKSEINGLIYYCAGRRMHLGVVDATAELDVISGECGDFVGALSLGEIGMAHNQGYPYFHNAAQVFSPWWKA